MAQQQNDFFPISDTWSLTSAFPSSPAAPSEYYWDYDCGNICVQQPRRRRAILPRSWIGRPTAPPESVTTYKCSYYRKCYSKRCPIWPRNHLHCSCAPPPRCTMNQLTFGYRWGHNMWY